MNIIKQNNFSGRDLYELRYGQSDKMSEHVGETLTLDGYVVVELERTAGEIMTICGIKSAGKLYGTNSPTFIDQFLDAIDMLENVDSIKPMKRRGKNNREYLTCQIG